MKLLTADKATLAWNPDSDEVAVVERPDETAAPSEWARHRLATAKYKRSCLGCCRYVSEADFAFRKLIVFVEAMHLIVRDGVDPQALHKALLQLKEYRDGLSSDMPGMNGEEDYSGHL